MLLANQILHQLCIFIKQNVWYEGSLEILANERWFPFNFAKTLQGRHFLVGSPKNFKLLKYLFWEQPSKYRISEFTAIFMCLLLKVDLDDIQSTEVATSTARNFNNSWPIYLHFSNMINLCPNIWFIKDSKCQKFVFWKRSLQKTQIFHIFKRPLFCNGWLCWYEFWRILRDSCGLSKKFGFATFPKIWISSCQLECQK